MCTFTQMCKVRARAVPSLISNNVGALNQL